MARMEPASSGNRISYHDYSSYWGEIEINGFSYAAEWFESDYGREAVLEYGRGAERFHIVFETMNDLMWFVRINSTELAYVDEPIPVYEDDGPKVVSNPPGYLELSAGRLFNLRPVTPAVPATPDT